MKLLELQLGTGVFQSFTKMEKNMEVKFSLGKEVMKRLSVGCTVCNEARLDLFSSVASDSRTLKTLSSAFSPQLFDLGDDEGVKGRT